MTLADLEARCRSTLTKRVAGNAIAWDHSREVTVPMTRAIFRRLDDLALVMSERTGKRVSARQLAAILLADAVGAVETPPRTKSHDPDTTTKDTVP